MRNDPTLQQLCDTWIDAESRASEAMVAYNAAVAAGAPVNEASKPVGVAQHEAYLAKIKYEEARDKAELTSISDEGEAAAAASVRNIEARHENEMTWFKWKMGLMVLLLVGTSFAVVGGYFYWFLRDRPLPEPIVRMKGEPLGADAGSAQAFCEENIRKVAKDPATVDVPFVRNQGSSDEHVFNWGRQTSMVRMKNGMGLEVPVEVTCKVSASSGRITSLVVDGQPIYGLSN